MPSERAAAYERRSYDCYLRNEHQEALAARELALAEYEAAGDLTRQGDTHRWLARLAWFVGDNVRAEREAMHAVRLLEGARRGRAAVDHRGAALVAAPSRPGRPAP